MEELEVAANLIAGIRDLTCYVLEQESGRCRRFAFQVLTRGQPRLSAAYSDTSIQVKTHFMAEDMYIAIQARKRAHTTQSPVYSVACI